MKARMDWKSCLDTLTAKAAKPDDDMIKSLIKMSKNRLLSEGKLEMNDVTAASKFSLAYDSLRELLEALAFKHGYKVYNHECFTAFLKEVMKQSDKGDEFDTIRKIRNAVNYYGKDISPKEADKIISKIKELRKFVLELIEK